MNDEVRAFLDEKPFTAYLSTIDLKGFPHTVPVWFAVDGDDLISSMTTNRTRVKHVQANPKAAMTIGGSNDDRAGYLFQGSITIDDDPDYVLLKKVIGRYMTEDGIAQFMERVKSEHRIILRLSPTKIIEV